MYIIISRSVFYVNQAIYRSSQRIQYNFRIVQGKKEPIFLTKNGEGDLVLMSIEAYKYREEMLDLREKLLSTEVNRLSGTKTYTIAEK